MNSISFAHLLLFLSGAAALAHQILWTRRLVDVLGASSETFARVIGTFFVGLALGGALAAWKPAAPARGWRRVALAELVVALLALPVLLVVPVAGALRGLVSSELLKLVLPGLLMLPPALGMGLVFPSVAGALGSRARPVPLYLANTFGGVIGIAVLVGWALPVLGTWQSGLATCGVNLVVTGLAGRLASRGADVTARNPLAETGNRPGPIPQSAFRIPRSTPLAFGSGFLVLGLEVALQHQFAQVTINSHFSGATVLMFVLLALVVAGMLASRTERLLGSVPRALVVTLLGTAVVCALQPMSFHWMRPGLAALPYELPPVSYYPRVALLALGVMVPVFFAAGLTFPLLLHSLKTGRDGARELAVLLAVNGVGGWLGAEFAQRWLLPWAGLWGAMSGLALVALVMAGSAAFLATSRKDEPGEAGSENAEVATAGQRHLSPAAPGRRSRGWKSRAAGGLPFVAGLVVIALAGGYTRRLPQVSPVPGERVVEVRVGREGVVATVNQGPDDWRIVFNNTYTLGGSKAQANQERQAHLPLLLHGRAKRVGLLGLATGSTTAGAAVHPGVDRIEAVELSGLVIEFARRHFAPFNRGVLTNPAVRVFHEDARWVIADRAADYDVVIGDLFLPWRTGEGRLFTAEHFAAVRRALKPDGLFCQWLPLFQLTRPQFDVIARTFQREFPGVFLLRGDFYADLPIVGLCAFADGRGLGEVDWPAVARACERLRAAAVTDPLARHLEGVAMCVIGEPPPPSSGPVNTLGNGWLEWDAGHNIVGLRTPWFIGVPWAEFVRDTVRANAARLPAELRAAHDAGQFFLTLSVADHVKASALANLTAQMRERLPAPLRTDSAAAWRHWPMRLKPIAAAGREPLSPP